MSSFGLQICIDGLDNEALIFLVAQAFLCFNFESFFYLF
jgi:hypothetical protein